MADKYLPELTEADSLRDQDLMYTTGQTSDDEKLTIKNMRKLTAPYRETTAKSVSYAFSALDCDGSWFSNNGAGGPITFTLPVASDGLMVGLLVEDAKYLNISPQAGEQIVYLTSAPGKTVRNKTVGSSIFLRATDNNWYVVNVTGTWAEV